MNPQRMLGTAGMWGALLTIVILAMSVLLRLGTQMEAGEAVSTLPAGVEQWARIAHRVAAMGVGILAALALVTAWKAPEPDRSRLAVGAVVALTLVLSVVGRYSPGYRIDLVTVVNVAGGVALAAAFWSLRAHERAAPREGMAWAALLLLVVLAALGAGADAAAMRGERAYVPLHLWIAALFTVIALTAAWRQRARRAIASAIAILTLAQVALGFALVAMPGSRALAPGWLHAMIACALALLLVSLGARSRR